MDRPLFTRIVRELSDAVGKPGISALVKCTSAIRQLAYGAVPDSLDEYIQICDKTSRDCLMAFCNGVMEFVVVKCREDVKCSEVVKCRKVVK
ncbi:hypothetical protein Tco_0193946 [Tanacetum coccineum]